MRVIRICDESGVEFAQKEVDFAEVLRDVEVVPSEAVETKAFGPFATMMRVACLLGSDAHSATGTPAGESLMGGKDGKVANSG